MTTPNALVLFKRIEPCQLTNCPTLDVLQSYTSCTTDRRLLNRFLGAVPLQHRAMTAVGKRPIWSCPEVGEGPENHSLDSKMSKENSPETLCCGTIEVLLFRCPRKMAWFFYAEFATWCGFGEKEPMFWYRQKGRASMGVELADSSQL